MMKFCGRAVIKVEEISMAREVEAEEGVASTEVVVNETDSDVVVSSLSVSVTSFL